MLHPFHLVTLSPWPLFISLILLSLGLNLISWLTSGINGFSLLFILASMFFISFLWFRDIIREGLGGYSTKIVQRGLIISFILFLITEIMLFFSFFWAFFDFSLAPGIELGNIWPPVGINPISIWSIPLLGCSLLLAGGFFLTEAHENFFLGNRNLALWNFIISILCTSAFLGLQIIEFSFSEFSISDSAYGSVFFATVGLHLIHVLVAGIFLIISYIRLLKNEFTTEHSICLDLSIYYYHLVDLVYLFLVICFYWWGG